MSIGKVSRKGKKGLFLTSVLAVWSLAAAGCGKTPASDVNPTESFESIESEAEWRTENYEGGWPAQMPAFTTKDLNGDVITEDVFGQKDLTVVNIWGTFCPPCIAEMPELGEWADSMPDNIQLVGLIIDIAGDEDTAHRDLAVTIAEKAGVKFTNIIANSDFDTILKWVVGVPTTLFVDKEGNLVGTPIVGANVEGYKTFVEEYLNAQ